MNLRSKMLTLLITIGLLPAILISVISLSTATASLKKDKFDHLESLREVKSASVNRYLDTISNQATALAKDPMLIQAMKGFETAFNSYAAELQLNQGEQATQKTQLENYYNTQFLPKLASVDPTTKQQAKPLVSLLEANAVALQSAYIKDNPNATGEKDKLMTAADGTTYASIHAKLHPVLRDFQQRFGFYDIFLIDAVTGNIVYTVFKEIDYTTSLISGPYADSGLGKAFNLAKANTQASTHAAILVDFTRYLPSYNAPAGFLAAAIYDDAQNLVGILALQFPLDRLNEIMSERSGLGRTGETYLVGPDYLMRSDSFLDPLHHSVEASFRSPDLGQVKTDATKLSAEGKTGSAVIIDYNGNPVLSAYGRVKFPGLNWSILAEIDEAEAFESVAYMRNLIVIILIATLLTVAFTAYLVTQSIMAPLGGEPKEMAHIADRISKGDLTFEFKHSGTETGIFKSMHTMANDLQRIVSQISAAAQQQAAASLELAAVTQQANQTIDLQQRSTHQVTTAITQMAASVDEVSKNTSTASDTAKDARMNIHSSSQDVMSASHDIAEVSTALGEAKIKIDSLKKNANDIAGILESIKGIADQTNLLALNAAIEAARAGEQGRGFAVVADEVRSLSQNTQKSTLNIADMISNLQKSSDEASRALEISVDKAQSVSSRTMVTAENLNQAVAAAEKIDDMMVQIASASEEQSNTAKDISNRIHDINSMGLESGAAAKQITESSEDLAQLANNLQQLIAHFKI